MAKIVKEAFVTSVEAGVDAANRGANRLLFAQISDGESVTAAYEDIVALVQKVKIPVKVLIRPRGGDFVYNEHEIERMKEQISFCKQQSVYGVALGVMQEDTKELDFEKIAELVGHALPLDVTVHRVIDSCKDPVKEVIELQKIKGVTAVLTSGASPTLEDGLTTVQLMTTHAPKLTIIATGGVTAENVAHFNQHIVTNQFCDRDIV